MFTPHAGRAPVRAEVDESEPEAVEENPAEEMPPDAPEPKKANRPSIMVADVFELEVAPEAIAIEKVASFLEKLLR